jgi:hypothetical protein
MPKTYCIANTLTVHKKEANACDQTTTTLSPDQIQIHNEVRQGEEVQWTSSEESSLVIAKLKNSGYQIPVQAWSFAQLALKCGSVYSALIQFAYNVAQPDEIIVMPVKTLSFSDVDIINNTYLQDKDLVPGNHYVVQRTDFEHKVDQTPLEYVGQFEDDTENRLIFIRGISLYQVKPGMNYVKKNDSAAVSLTAPRRTQLLEVMRAWADYTWYNPEVKDVYQDPNWRSTPIRTLFASDMEVSRLATKLCTLRKIAVGSSVSMYRTHPLNIRFDRAKQLEVCLDLGRNARHFSDIMKNFPIQRSVPAMSDLGRDVSAWREFFIEIYEKATPPELDIQWSTHPTYLVNDCYQSITNLR